MIITRAPFRLSFAGGGTDLAAYYVPFGGLVVSTAIDRYVYVLLREGKRGAPVHLISSDAGAYRQGHVGATPDTAGATHLPWAVLDTFGVRDGVEVFIASQVPSGTGLGSSSALAVALIQALAAYTGRAMLPRQVAELACTIEIEHLGSPIGKQDQYASALGGFNEITFSADGVGVRPLKLSAATREALGPRLMLFFTGVRRDANAILSQQRQASESRNTQTIESLHALKELAIQLVRVLEEGDLDAFGPLLDQAWQHKQRVSRGISNAFIDHCYDTARRAGARGGKIAGAGGGGFLLLDCLPEHQPTVTNALGSLGLEPFAFGFAQEPAGLVPCFPAGPGASGDGR